MNDRNISRGVLWASLIVLTIGFVIAFIILSGYKHTQKRPVGSVKIVSRTVWGAVEPNHDVEGESGLFDPVTNPEGWLVYEQPLATVLTTIVVHHSALPLSDGPLEIQYKHMQQKGFADIGYHFVIDATGQIYEGRRITTRGAHTGGYNTGAIGIVLLGNFEETEPTVNQIAALQELITLFLYKLSGFQLFPSNTSGFNLRKPCRIVPFQTNQQIRRILL